LAMGALLVLLLIIFGPLVAGIMVIKTLNQERQDRQRKMYRLTFPTDLSEDSVTAWIRAISGTLRFSSCV
jgi:hypothetical protein